VSNEKTRKGKKNLDGKKGKDRQSTSVKFIPVLQNLTEVTGKKERKGRMVEGEKKEEKNNV